jgi:hypothetical protein
LLFAAPISLISLLFLSCAIAAEEATFTVGIDTTCPYGLVNCWPEVREPIEGLRGVKTVSKRVDPKTLTCEVQMEQGLLLDAKALNKRVKDEAGAFFSVRGVEATLNGSLFRRDGEFVLQMIGGTNVLYLTPLRKKVQQDTKTKAAQLPDAAELAAYSRLVSESRHESSLVRVIGPLQAEGNRAILQVRQFDWLKDSHADVSQREKP